MANYKFISADSRGHINHGWLDTYHTFSFASYVNPERMRFGVLRVLNDDTIAPGQGFDKHPHDNMEIVTIPLEGELEHVDSMGHTEILRQGDIQVMSAGSGLYHSEYNKNPDIPLKLLQIWILTNKRGAAPRYDQTALKTSDLKNSLYTFITPERDNSRLWLHQNAWFSLGSFDKDFSTRYDIKQPDNGIFCFCIKGSFSVDNFTLNKRDGLGISEAESISLQSKADNSEILIMDIPMNN